MNTQLEKERIIELPEGFTARGATLNDLDAAMQLMNRWSRSITGEDEVSHIDVLRDNLLAPGFNMNQDTRLIFAPNGDLAGYTEVWTIVKPAVHPFIWGCVDPDYEDRGIGSWLLHWAEERALRVLPDLPADLRLAPHVSTYRQVEKAKRLFEDRGYRYIRSSYQMRIDMHAPVPEPEWPVGITLRTYGPGVDAAAVYGAQRDSFRDHFGFVEEPFEQGLERWKYFWEKDSFDPTLMFLAMDGDEVAGISLCPPHAFEDPNLGWVSTLGVRREWRKRGIGLALLRHSFNEFYRRGKRKVGLGVDAQNLTGALRLYENAGMHVHQAFDQYEKELRPGIEITVQSLTQEA